MTQKVRAVLEECLQEICDEKKPTFIIDDNPNKDIIDLNPVDVGKLVAMGGVVTRTSEVRPELLQGSSANLEPNDGGSVKFEI
ncbi:unnamed protein product [Camellia sinensis]